MVKRTTTPKVEIPLLVLGLVAHRMVAKGSHELALRLRSPGDSQRLTMLLQREMEGIAAMYLGETHLGVTQYSVRQADPRRTVLEAGGGEGARAAPPTWSIFDITFRADLTHEIAEGSVVEISSYAAQSRS